MKSFSQDCVASSVNADAVGLLVAGLTHDVRGALGGIALRTAVASDALEGGDACAARESLSRIHHVVSWISELCDDLLECSRRRGSVVEPQWTEFDLSDCVLACIRAQFQAVPSALELDLDIEPNITILSHPRSVERILVNLIRNALRHGAGGRIRVVVSDEQQHVAVTVRDTGRGIDSAKLERLLVPYERGEADASLQGFGLGLWIVSSLVSSLGGSLEIRSELGIGTGVCFRLPLTAPARGK